MTCSRPNCPDPDHYRELCRYHYEKAVRAGMFRMPPAAPVAAHVRLLLAAGWTGAEVAREAGVDPRTVYDLMKGRLQTVRPETADGLTGIPVIPRVPYQQVDNTGTRRRVQALAWMGWSCAMVARRVDLAPRSLATLILPGRLISARTAAKVAAVYEALHMRKGPSVNSARVARRQGFAPPLAWDPDTIDDPKAKPDPGRERRRSMVSVLAEVDHLVSCGVSEELAARRLGIHPDTVDTYRERLARRAAA